MKQILNKILIITVLVISLTASLVQFHSHDCGGHALLDCGATELHFCSNNHHQCMGGEPNPFKSNHHNHTNEKCVLHLEVSDVSSHHNSLEKAHNNFCLPYTLCTEDTRSALFDACEEPFSAGYYEKCYYEKIIAAIPQRGSPIAA